MMTTPLVDRPSLNPRERTVAVAFGIWMVVGLFLDGWAHDNNKPESFFTPWHGVLYSGFAAATLAAVLVAARSRTSDRPGREPLHAGHGLTDRKSVGWGKGGYVRVDLGGGRY